MDSGDPDVPSHKRPRLDSVNPPAPPFNGRPYPPHPPQNQPARHPAQPSSPGLRHHPPPHGLPHLSHQYPPSAPHPGPPPPGPPHYPPPHQPHLPPASLPPSDLRGPSDPTRALLHSPHQRTHGGFPVTVPATTTIIDQDRISDYQRPPPAPSAGLEPQTSRSTPIDAKPPPGMDHGGHPPPWPPVNQDHRPNGSYTNGYHTRVVSPQQQQEHQFQPPPAPPGQQYAPQAVAYAGTPVPYIGGSAAAAAAYAAQNVKRKQVRATQACNHCRARKQKCDEARPCQFCRESGLDCQYKDVPPPKQDRSMMQLQESVNAYADRLDRLDRRLDKIDDFFHKFMLWQQKFERALPNATMAQSPMAHSASVMSPDANHITQPMNTYSPSVIHSPIQGRTPMARVGSVKTESPIVPHSVHTPASVSARTPSSYKQESCGTHPPGTPTQSVVAERTSSEEEREWTGLRGDHTTPAHRVLESWPLMNGFCDTIEVIKRLESQNFTIGDYPLKLEQARGLLRVWGVGEGPDMNDGTQGPSSPESQTTDTPSPPAGRMAVWGSVKAEVSSPSTLGPDVPEDPVGGLGPDGQLKLDWPTLEGLFSSYTEHIHTLHPFVNLFELKRMVKNFSTMYGPEAREAKRNQFGVSGLKRKREGPVPNGEIIDRSLHNAIVLFVLALGKACQYTEPLPAPYADRAPAESTLWGFRRSSSRTTNSSFSSDYDTDLRPRNIDILPGMAYFSYATDILGNQQGGNTIGHAQAHLLAGLYLGQFARVLESWSWIHNACRVCAVLVKDELPYILRPPKEGEAPAKYAKKPASEKEIFRLDLIKCIYWTCLQLEADILAEMSTLPPIRISEYQGKIHYPEGVFETFPEESADSSTPTYNDKDAMYLYSCQIMLRVVLNEAHNSLYNTGKGTYQGGSLLDPGQLFRIAKAAKIHGNILELWRNTLPTHLAWRDEDPPSTDLNVARLRAKFYGGYYMILRPFLYIAIHEVQITREGRTSNIQESVRNCIEAAIQSTIAFDNVGAEDASAYRRYIDISKKRLLVTNIFGTLHAQFGNMIVLAAVYKKHYIGGFDVSAILPRETLSLLYIRTIKMLRQIGDNSPVLTTDADILENIQKQLGLETRVPS